MVDATSLTAPASFIVILRVSELLLTSFDTSTAPVGIGSYVGAIVGVGIGLSSVIVSDGLSAIFVALIVDQKSNPVFLGLYSIKVITLLLSSFAIAVFIASVTSVVKSFVYAPR